MTVSTIYGIAGDGYVESTNTTYATARSGSSLWATTTDGNNIVVGQIFATPNYFIEEGCIGFDTSVVGADSVSVAVLSLWLLTDGSATDFVNQARLQTWSVGGLTTADWVAGASLTQTLLASINSSGIGATGAYKNFTSEAAFLTNINGGGNTEIILCSDRHVAGTTPTGDERLHWDDADTAGTSQDPKLVVTHAPGVVNATVTGVTAAATAAGIAGVVTANVFLEAAIAGVTATATAEGIVGSVAAQVQTSVTGVTAAATAAGISGVVVAHVQAVIAGVTATATAAGIAGAVATVRIANIVGATASAIASGIAGIVSAIMTTGGVAGPSVAGTLDTGGSSGPSIAATDTGGSAGPHVAGTLDTGGSAGPTIPYSGPW